VTEVVLCQLFSFSSMFESTFLHFLNFEKKLDWTHFEWQAKKSLAHAYTWFPALRCRFRNRFRKNRFRTCRSVCRRWGVCTAVARQAQEAGRRVSRSKEWAEFQASWLCTERQVRKNRTRSYMNGSTATANLRKRRTLFLRRPKLQSSYGILTDERTSYLLLQRTTAIRQRWNGYVMVETTH